MELNCLILENLYLDKISEDEYSKYPIFCFTIDKNGNRNSISFTKDGCVTPRYGSKCVIFPKGKTTWEGFQRPFKDGDIVAYDNPHRDNVEIFIFKDKRENNTLSYYYLMLDGNELELEEGSYYVTRLATEEEKQKLFDVIKANGYKWNPETKTLEKLVEPLVEPKFKPNDIVETNDNLYGCITDDIEYDKDKKSFKYYVSFIVDGGYYYEYQLKPHLRLGNTG